MLVEGKLVDAYRTLHPERGENDYTWRGWGQQPTGKYYGKGMRIDYTLVSKQLLEDEDGLEIARAEVIGRGIDTENFYRSDHCCILLELRPKRGTEGKEGEAKEEGKEVPAADGGSKL